MRQGAVLLFLLLAGCAPAKEVARTARPTAAAVATAAPALGPPGVVATFDVTNDDRRLQAARVVSFGQLFPPGRVRPDTRLEVTLNGRPADWQMDPKALGSDGAVRHAVLSIRTPPMAAGATLHGVIRTTAARQARAGRPAALPPRVDLTLRLADAPTAVVHAVLEPARGAIVAQGPPWLAGPLVREQRYALALGRGLQADLDVWTPTAGPSRVDLILHNDAAQNSDIATQGYDLSLQLDGRAAFSVAGVRQPPYTTWRRTVWSDGAPPPRITPDTRALMALGATPDYARIHPDPAAARALHKAATSNPGPLSLAGVTPYMPTTGGRADIGPLPTWAVFYLLDPTRENQETLMADASAAGAMPWHVRDPRTGRPVRADQHPDVWLDDRGRAVPGVLGRRYARPEGPIEPDDAHQPSLSYLTYLLTGSQYDRDELAMQAAYVVLAVNPDYRGPQGLLLGSQVRALAWDLRTLANAAFILPADDPLQAYFEARLRDNLRAIQARYVTGRDLEGAGELRGYVPGPYLVQGAVAPWQEDYLVMVLGWIDSMGFAEARPVLEWMTNFVAGRFTSGDRGYDPIYGTPYYLRVADPQSNAPLTRWGDAFRATFDPVRQPVRTLDYPAWGGGYAALARGALASLVHTTGSPKAREAYAYVRAHTPRMEAGYPTEPTFAMDPGRP